nr:hypothetical protein [uncultured Lichenicoccus sp.]
MHASLHPVLFHHAYGGGYGYHHSYGGSGWVASMVVSALVHALIYGVVFRLMRHLTLPEAILLAAGGLLLVYMWSRSRDRRGGW